MSVGKRRRTRPSATPLPYPPPSSSRRAARDDASRSADAAKAVAYVRASTDDQALSPEVQGTEIAAYCEARGIELLDVIEEHKSGKLSLHERAGARRAIDRVRELGAGVLVVQRRDRLARHVGHARAFVDAIEAAGARVRTADGLCDQESAATRLLATILDAIAEFEGELIVERTGKALGALRSRGKLLGAAPYGTRGAGVVKSGERDLVTDADEAAAVQRAVELDAEGLSLRRIARSLELEGYRPRGERWYAETVRRLLARRRGGSST